MDTINSDQRFSPVSFVANIQHNEFKENESSRFQHIVEDVRNSLVSEFRAEEAEHGGSFGDLLNRAVLGYASERKALQNLIEDLLAKKRLHRLPPPNRKFSSLAEAVFAEVIGMNILELIMANRAGLEEIQVVGKDVFEVRNGQVNRSPYQFDSVKDVERIQQNLVLYNQDVLNPRKQWAETMLSDGARVTMTGFGFTSEPTLTIRFFPHNRRTLEQLASPNTETIDPSMIGLLRSIVRARFNVIIIGSTNSGKTQLMKSLISEVPSHERMVTIEARLELQLRKDLPHYNIVEYEVMESDSLHDSRQAFKLALRQSPDRIIHAEVRDDDANTYVRACTRGHEGSMTTLHANMLEDAPEALTDMCMLDQRGMDPNRLTKRITQYVTQIGLEMRMVGHQRRLVRVGEYEWCHDHVRVRDWILYDPMKQKWVRKDTISSRAKQRFVTEAPDSLQQLYKEGWIAQ